MDLSKLSEKDLQAIQAGKLDMVSPEALEYLSAQSPSEKVPTGPDRTSMAGRFATGLADPFHGGAQLLEQASPKKIVDRVREVNNAIPGMAKIPLGGVDQSVRQRERDYQADRGEEGGKFDVWRAAGNVLSPANLAMSAVPAFGPVNILSRIGQGAAAGGLGGALQPVTEGKPEEYWDQKLRQTGTGAIWGGGATAAANALGRIISPRAAQDADRTMLRTEGVPMSIGQTLGGPANVLEDIYARIPVLGAGARAARERANTGFQQAAMNRSGQHINAPRVTEGGVEGVEQASRAVNQAYQRAESALQGFRVDQQWLQDSQLLRQAAHGEPWEREFNNVMRTRIANHIDRNTGALPADRYHDAVRELRALAERARASKLPNRDNLAAQYTNAATAMQQAARRFNPQAEELFQQADRAFAQLAPVQQAAANTAKELGEFTPRDLMGAVKQGDKTVRDNRTARGQSPQQDLAAAGIRVLGPERSGSLVPTALGAGAAGTAAMLNALPEAAGAAIAGRVIYNPQLQAALRAAAMTRSPGAQRVGNMVEQASPRLAPLAAAYGSQPRPEADEE